MGGLTAVEHLDCRDLAFTKHRRQCLSQGSGGGVGQRKVTGRGQ